MHTGAKVRGWVITSNKYLPLAKLIKLAIADV